MTTSTFGRSSINIGFSNSNGFPLKKLLLLLELNDGKGEALLKTGSVITTKPSVFIMRVECPNHENLPSVKSLLLNFIVGRGFRGFLSLGGENQSLKVAFFSEARKLV